MATHHEKMTKKPKKTKGETEAQHFEDVARKIFKVPKTEITENDKKA
jgi:hypothetical protein